MSVAEEEEDAFYRAFLESSDRRMLAPPEDNSLSIEFPYGGNWRECQIWEGNFSAEPPSKLLHSNGIFGDSFHRRGAIDLVR